MKGKTRKLGTLLLTIMLLAACGGESSDDSGGSTGTTGSSSSGCNLLIYILTLGFACEPVGTSGSAGGSSGGTPGSTPSLPTREEAAMVSMQVYDTEPNNDISSPSGTGFPARRSAEQRVGFHVEGTINNMSDGIDTYAFTAGRAHTFSFKLCTSSETYCSPLTDPGGIETAVAYVNVLDQFGEVLTTSRLGSENTQLLDVDAGVLYYVMVLAENTANQDRTYFLSVAESAESHEPEIETAADSRPAAPVLSASSVGSLTATLDWTPPTLRADGSPLLDLAGYVVHYGPTPGGPYQFTTWLENPGLATMVLNLPDYGAWYAVIAAFDSDRVESELSNEVEMLDPGVVEP